MASTLPPAVAELANLVDLHQQAVVLAPTDPESAHAARHLAYAIGKRLQPAPKGHRVLLAGGAVPAFVSQR